MTNRKVSNLKNKGAQEFKKLAESSSHSKANKRPQKRASRDMLSYLFSPETVELLEDIPLKVIRDTWIKFRPDKRLGLLGINLFEDYQ